MLINTATVTSHKSDFCRYVASINHRKWAVLMLTTGTWWHIQRYMICTLQEKQQTLQSSSRLCFPASTADLMHRIKTELCEFCMNKSFTSVYHFISCCVLSSSSLLSISVGVWEEEDVVNWARWRLTPPPPRKLRWTAWFWRWISPTVSVNWLFQLWSARPVFIL